MLNGSLCGEMSVQIDVKCDVYESIQHQKGSSIVSSLTSKQCQFLVLYRTNFKKVLYRTTYNTFSINVKNHLSMLKFTKEPSFFYFLFFYLIKCVEILITFSTFLVIAGCFILLAQLGCHFVLSILQLVGKRFDVTCTEITYVVW